MKNIVIGKGVREVSDNTLQCKWCEVVLVDATGTTFEYEDWIPKFVNAETEEDAIEVFNARFKGEWKMITHNSVQELTPHSWIERKSMTDFFRLYIHVYILMFLSKYNTPDLSYNSFDDINHHYIGKYNLFELNRTSKGFYLLSMDIDYVPIDSDSQYLYMVLDKEGNVIEPLGIDGPWVCITSKLKSQGYL